MTGTDLVHHEPLHARRARPGGRRRAALLVACWIGAVALASARLLAPGAPPAAETPAQTRVRVLDARGRPVPEAAVRVGAGAPAVTDLGGEVRVPRGAARLEVAAAGFARWTGALPDAARVAVRLEPAARVRGRVSDGAGRPLARVEVQAARPDAPGLAPHLASSGADGTFRFDALAPGPWELRAQAPGRETVARLVEARTGSRTPEVELALREVGRVVAVVRAADGTAAAGAEVTLAGSAIWPPREAVADARGRAVFAAVPAGFYALRARRGGALARSRAAVVLEAGEEALAELGLEPGWALEVTVRDAATGEPLGEAAVTVTDGGLADQPRVARTGADGVASFAALPPGRARIAVRAEGFVSAVDRVEPGPEGRAAAEVALLRAGRVAGRVLLPDGRPAADATVEVVGLAADGAPLLVAAATDPEGAPSPGAGGELGVMPGLVPPLPVGGAGPAPAAVPPPSGGRPLRTDAEGRFEVRGVAPGRHRVHARVPGQITGVSDEFALRPGEQLDDVEVLIQPGGAVEGRVVDARGFPVGGVAVHAAPENELRTLGTVSRPDGTFTLAPLRGPVSLTASPEGLPPTRVDVQVPGGRAVDVTLALAAEASRMRGRTVDDRGYPIPGVAVAVESLRAEAPVRRHVWSGEDGTFEVGGLPPPPWRVTADHPEHARLRVPRVDEELDEVQLVLRPASALSGRTLDAWTRAAPADAVVELRGEAGVRTARPDGDGAFRFGRVAPGRYTLVVRSPSHLPVERPVRVGDAAVALDPVWLEPGGAVAGQVVDRWGEPVGGAEVAPGAPPRWAQAERTDALGRFTLRGLRPGPTALTARHPEAGTGTALRPVPVRKAEETPGVHLRLPGALPR